MKDPVIAQFEAMVDEAPRAADVPNAAWARDLFWDIDFDIALGQGVVVVAGVKVVRYGADPTLAGFDATTGKLLWQTGITKGGKMTLLASAENGRVVVGGAHPSRDAFVVDARDVQNGRPLWRFESPVGEDERLLSVREVPGAGGVAIWSVTSDKLRPTVRVFNALDGSALWNLTLAPLANGNRELPGDWFLPDEGGVVFLTQSRMVRVDEAGTVIWELESNRTAPRGVSILRAGANVHLVMANFTHTGVARIDMATGEFNGAPWKPRATSLMQTYLALPSGNVLFVDETRGGGQVGLRLAGHEGVVANAVFDGEEPRIAHSDDGTFLALAGAIMRIDETTLERSTVFENTGRLYGFTQGEGKLAYVTTGADSYQRLVIVDLN